MGISIEVMTSLLPLLVALVTIVFGLRLRAETTYRKEAAVLILAPLAIGALTFGSILALQSIPGETVIGIGVWGLAFLLPVMLILVLLVEMTAIGLFLQRIDRSRTGLVAALWPLTVLALVATAVM